MAPGKRHSDAAAGGASYGRKGRHCPWAARKRSRIGLALAGGGPVGGIYEVGAMAALAEALEGVDFTELRHLCRGQFGGLHVGCGCQWSRACQLWRGCWWITIADEVFDPEMLLRPAFSEYLRRALAVPVLFWSSLRQYLSDPWHLRLVWRHFRVSVMPSRRECSTVPELISCSGSCFRAEGRSNDFRQLRHRLFIVATDLDTGESVAFGSAGA
jgi:NTE family protein